MSIVIVMHDSLKLGKNKKKNMKKNCGYLKELNKKRYIHTHTLVTTQFPHKLMLHPVHDCHYMW